MKVLIAENKEQADQHIQHLNRIASGINELIAKYNTIEALANIETREQIKNFLESPREFLDHAVMNETGLSIKGKPPPPDKIAELYSIDYAGVMNQVEQTNMNGLEHLKYNESENQIEFDPASEKHIREAFKEFARDENEAEMILKIRKVCTDLNKLSEYFGLYPHDLNRGAEAFGFMKAEVNADGHGWELKENINVLRHKLEYEQTHAK